MAPALVLLIDGDANGRAGYRRALERAGYEVLEAGDGMTGLALARERVPDAVVLDLALDGLDGLQLIDQLRLRLRDVRAVVIAADASSDERARAASAGCTSFLDRPLTPAALVEELRRLTV